MTKKYEKKSTRKEGETRGRKKGQVKIEPQEMIKHALEIIEKDEFVHNFETLFKETVYSKQLFYQTHPAGSEGHQIIQATLENNAVKLKKKLRKVMFDSGNATMVLALYRLLSTPEEHLKLNQSHIDHTTKGKGMNIPIAKWVENPEEGEE